MNLINLKLAVINMIMHIDKQWVQVEDIEDFQEEHLEIRLNRPTLLLILRELVLSYVLQARLVDEDLIYAFREDNKAHKVTKFKEG